MVAHSIFEELSVDQLLARAISKEEDLLLFYQGLLPHSEYDVHQVFERFAAETSGRMKRLEDLRSDLAMLRTLTEPMAD